VWLDSHAYQYANRLAHLCFFERLGVPAGLAHVYFTDDRTHLPTTAEQFDEQRDTDGRAMGLDAKHRVGGGRLPACRA
jgi:hypothetical protein